MSVWLVLPMKSLLDGKSRLAPALNLDQRRALLERMFKHTLDTAAKYPGLDRTMVVSGCAETRSRAEALGAQVLEEESGAGLNGGLRQAQHALRRHGASHMMVVHCDLPRLEENDLRKLAQAADSNRIAIAPDRLRQGTNGLGMDVSLEFRFFFGADSYALHREEAKRLGLQAQIVESVGLGFDVDQPEHLADLAAS